ncbi:MAG: protein-L-isoaspartate(D-aspartate) O-methyltransferase [Simkania negevensis]|nr:protein-L-isoaspartate(D-aspartate) O-methyltransferase [Simkania negevensis]
MVREQIEARGIRDPAVLAAMRAIPREEFVLPAHRSLAYIDRPLPIEENQTISQPYIVALMAEALQLKPEDHLLEIGTGSGYAAAVLSQIVSHVYTIEYFPKLAQSAAKRLQELGYSNIAVQQGDGSLGLPEHASYPAISVAAGGAIPPPLLEQLAVHGRLLMPVKQNDSFEELMRVTKQEKWDFTYEKLGAVCFVPLLGKDH